MNHYVLVEGLPGSGRVESLNVYLLSFVNQSESSGYITYINLDPFRLTLVVDCLEIEPTPVSSSICVNPEVKVILVLGYFHGAT